MALIKKEWCVQPQIPRCSVTMGCGSPQISGVMGLTTAMTTVMRGIAVSYHSDIKIFIWVSTMRNFTGLAQFFKYKYCGFINNR